MSIGDPNKNHYGGRGGRLWKIIPLPYELSFGNLFPDETSRRASNKELRQCDLMLELKVAHFSNNSQKVGPATFLKMFKIAQNIWAAFEY